MFTRKKRFFERKGFYITLVAMFSIVYMLSSLISSPEEVNENENINTNAKQIVEPNNSEEENISQNTNLNSDNKVQESQSSEYYLVKECDGLIKVYKYDSDGKEELLRTTDILFSLLSEEDQKLFSKGVVIKTQNELLELLQDFES